MVYCGTHRGFKHDCVFVDSLIKMRENFFNSKYFILCLVAIFVLVLIALSKEGYRCFRISQEIRDLEKNIADLKKSTEELSRTKDYFQSREFLEEEARKKLNLVKEGEHLIIVASGQDSEEEAIMPEESEKSVPNLELWREYFFGKK